MKTNKKSLSAIEQELLKLLAEGYNTQEIAEKVNLKWSYEDKSTYCG